MRFLYRIRLAAAIVLVAIIALFSSASAAFADEPIVWNANGGPVPMYWGTRTSSGISEWLPNSSEFGMQCWVDDEWYEGNYWSNRWFFGQSFATGDWGNVPAAFVYYQVSVPPLLIVHEGGQGGPDLLLPGEELSASPQPAEVAMLRLTPRDLFLTYVEEGSCPSPKHPERTPALANRPTAKRPAMLVECGAIAQTLHHDLALG